MSRASNLNKIIFEMRNGYVPAILVPVSYGMLAPILQFMLGVCQGTLPLTFAALIGKAKCICHNCKYDFSKKLPCLMLVLFLQIFTGQHQVTPSINCTIQSFFSTVSGDCKSWANHLHS